MMNLIKTITSKIAPGKDGKAAPDASCGPSKDQQAKPAATDKGGCCGGHCH